MKLLAEITEESLGVLPTGEVLGKEFKLRKSARGIILNDQGEVSPLSLCRRCQQLF